MKAYLKLREWTLRYGPAELVSGVIVVSLATTIFWMTRSRAWAALAAALIEAPTYYSVMWLRDERVGARNRLKGLSTEFGPASIVTVALRPFLLYECPLLVGSIAWGTAIAKVATDFCFYSLVICMYETVGKHGRVRVTHRLQAPQQAAQEHCVPSSRRFDLRSPSAAASGSTAAS